MDDVPPGSTVWITFTNSGYMDMMLNWVCPYTFHTPEVFDWVVGVEEGGGYIKCWVLS